MILHFLCKLSSYGVIPEETITLIPVFIGDKLSSKVHSELSAIPRSVELTFRTVPIHPSQNLVGLEGCTKLPI